MKVDVWTSGNTGVLLFWISTYPVNDVALATYKSPILYLDDEQK